MAGAKAPLTFRIFKGDQLIREEKLSLSVIKLGKVPSAHLKLDDETVSRMHAIIEVNGPGDVSIIDLGSTKGTFVNGQKVNKAKLQTGDTIVVGETRIELTIGSEDDVATNVATPSIAAPSFDSGGMGAPRPPAPGAAPPAFGQMGAQFGTQLGASAPPPPPMQSSRPAAPLGQPAPMAPAPTMPSNQPPMAMGPASYAMPMAPAPSAGMPQLRPPPGHSAGHTGGAPIYGTAMAPPIGFQQAMAESADEIGGARAIEVAAMLGDSVVGVRHVMNPRGGKVSAATYAMFAAGVVLLIVSAISFRTAVQNAAYNKDKADAETTCLDGKREIPHCVKKPMWAVRPRELWAGYDFLMIGGLLVGIGMLTSALSRSRGEKVSPFFRIGTAPNVEFATEGAPSASFALVAPHGDDFAFHFGPGMDGEMVVGGQSTSLAELAAQGRTTISPIPMGAKIRARAGKTTFLVSAVAQPRRQATSMFASLESRVLAYFAGSLAAHLGFWAILQQIPYEDQGTNGDMSSLEDTSTRTNSVSQDDPAMQEQEDKPDDSDAESGGSGQAMALEEGKMGKKDSTRAEGQFKMQKLQADPVLARQQAVEAAKTAGILGTTALTSGAMFASLTGSGDISSGFDDSNIQGGLLGNEAGEMQGGFGAGRSGFGPGGGGTGWGTIGTGRYGTIGHGSGTGAGYGVGGGRGGMRGRTSSVPTVSIGQPSAQGDLDKAIIRRYIKRNIQKIQYCYEKELLAKPTLAGTVSAQFFITPNGNVSSSNGSGVDGSVSSCVANVIKGIEFPKPKGGGGVQVNYPFTFRPSGS